MLTYDELENVKEVILALNGCSNFKKNYQFTYKVFTDFIQRVGEAKFSAKFLATIDTTLISQLQFLEKHYIVKLIYESDLLYALSYIGLSYHKINSIYKEIENDAEVLFPVADSISYPKIDANLLEHIVDTDFFQNYHQFVRDNQLYRIYNITFNNFSNLNFVCTSALINEKHMLIKIALFKLQNYFTSNEKNYIFIYRRIINQFTGRDLIVQKILKYFSGDIHLSFQFLMTMDKIYFSVFNAILMTLQTEIQDKLPNFSSSSGSYRSPETDLIIAIIIVRTYFNSSKKSNTEDSTTQERKNQEEKAIQLTQVEILDKLMMQKPYIYTVEDLVLLAQKQHTQNNVISFNSVVIYFSERESLTEEEEQLNVVFPTVIKSQYITGNNIQKTYYIHKKNIVLFLCDSVITISKELENFYLNSWSIMYKNGSEFTTMRSQKDLNNHIYTYLTIHYPVLSNLLTYNTIQGINQDDFYSSSEKLRIKTWLIKDSVRIDYGYLFKLNKKDLMATVIHKSSKWMQIKFLVFLYHTIVKYLHGSAHISESDAQFDHMGQQIYDKKNYGKKVDNNMKNKKLTNSELKLLNLQKKIIPSTLSVEEELNRLIHLWNPLLGKEAEILVLDINNLCKDMIRVMHRRNRNYIPTVEELEEMAQRIQQNKIFSRIRDKNAFQKYIELYFLRLLNPTILIKQK